MAIDRCLTLFTFALSAVFIASCGGLKPGSGSSAKGLYTAFYVGEEGTQYFIKPLAFEGDEGRAAADFTFRLGSDSLTNARVVISVLGDEVIRKADSVTFANQDLYFSSDSVKLLFNERLRKNVESRIEVLVPVPYLTGLFNQDDWKIVIYRSERQTAFYAGKKTRKRIASLRHDIFSLYTD